LAAVFIVFLILILFLEFFSMRNRNKMRMNGWLSPANILQEAIGM